MTRLAVAAAAAGTICAVGAGAAMAAPAASWSGPKGPIPGAITNDTPTVSSIAFPGTIGQGTLVAWRGRGSVGGIFYRYRAAGLDHGKWSARATLAGASTSSAPVFRSYTDALGNSAILAVWTGHADHHIWYKQGETKANGTISWNAATVLPAKVKYTNTTNAPAVLFTNHAYRVVFSWRGPGNHVRYSVGTPASRGFIWSNSAVVPGAPGNTKYCSVAPCTADTPAVAEVQTSASSGTIYFFWRQLATHEIWYSTTVDTAANLASPVFTVPVQVPGALTDQAPAASDSGLAGFAPLLLAYKAPFSTSVRFQTLTSGVWSAPVRIAGVGTAAAPALFINTLATTSPGADGNIFWRLFS